MGCGYEPQRDAMPWSHPASSVIATVCPGYACSLPEVREASWARFYLHKGSLAQWSATPLTEVMRAAIEALELAEGAVEAWVETPKARGGGGA